MSIVPSRSVTMARLVSLRLPMPARVRRDLPTRFSVLTSETLTPNTFSTASSEAVYPKLMEQLEKFGIKPRVTGFVLPLGYSFNLDGSMMYTTFAALFISQAYNLPLTLFEQLTMLFVLMVSSKGIAGVPRASLVVVAAVLPMFGLPEAGLLIILGVDQFLDMGRTVTNVLGNTIATAVVAKWEHAIDPVAAPEDGEEIDVGLELIEPMFPAVAEGAPGKA